MSHIVSSLYKDVQRFHEKFHLEGPPTLRFHEPALHTFRVGFLREELQEYVDSVQQSDLGTALDSLIDLVYVTCGALIMHGLTPARFQDYCLDYLAGTQELDVYDPLDQPIRTKPAFLEVNTERELVHHLTTLIDSYTRKHQSGEHDLETDVIPDLIALYFSTLNGASLMGVSPDCWDELWNDVQRANMQKERVLRAEDSKRGSIYDVRKPEGWVPPQTQEILEKYL